MTLAETPTFPSERLEGERFVLRPLRLADVDDITVACQDGETLAWLPLPVPYLRKHAVDFVTRLASSAQRSGTGVVYGMEAGDRLAGCIDLKRTDWRARTTEVGYWVAPWARGARLAARATRLLAGWALRDQGMERVELRAAVGNVASQRTAELAGLTKEGVLRNSGFLLSGRVDLVVYSLVPSDLDP